MRPLFRSLAICHLALASAGIVRGAEQDAAPRPTAADLVAHVIADEGQIDTLDSFYVRLEGESTQSAAAIAVRLAKHKAEFPDEKIDPARDVWLWPAWTREVEVAFDRHRARKLDRQGNSRLSYEDLRVFDGRRETRHQTTSHQEYYALTAAADSWEVYFGELGWPKLGSHRFAFSKPEPPKRGRYWLNRRPEDYALAGVADFAGRQCYVLENGTAMRRLHVAVDDRRLHGWAALYLPTGADLLPAQGRAAQRSFSSDAEFSAWWERLTDQEQARFHERFDVEKIPLLRPMYQCTLDDYRELAPGFWFPARQDWIHFESDGDGPALECHRRSHLVEAKVNVPLPDSLFALEMRDGIQVCDWGHDPPLFYTQKADRSPEEWNEIIDKRVKEEEEPRRHQAAREAQVGQRAPQLSAVGWINSAPLNLKGLRGKIVLLDFWAVGCLPCRADLPLAESIHKAAERSGIVVIGVHPAGADPAEIRAFAKQNRMSYPILIDREADEDEPGFGLLFTRLSVDQTPYSILIDPDGKVAGHGTLNEMLAAAREMADKMKK